MPAEVIRRDPIGLDLSALEGFLERERPDLVHGPLTAWTLTGGKSNITYVVDGGSSRLVLRRPPLGHLEATAHDVSREFQVMRALAGTAVPVPTMHLRCEDPAVIGAPFFLMEWIEGATYRKDRQLRELGAERTEALSTALVTMLADLHAVDHDTIGLGDLGRPGDFCRRQVRRWTRQLAAIGTDVAGAEELAGRLAETAPDDWGTSLVHGDYRLDNLLVDDTDTIRAVLDWEMSTLGDPLTDLALMLVYRDLGRFDTSDDAVDVGDAPGFLSPERIVETYQARAGRALPDLGFHLGLAYFKLAVIYEGVRSRQSNNQTGEGFVPVDDVAEPLVAAGLDALGRA